MGYCVTLLQEWTAKLLSLYFIFIQVWLCACVLYHIFRLDTFLSSFFCEINKGRGELAYMYFYVDTELVPHKIQLCQIIHGSFCKFQIVHVLKLWLQTCLASLITCANCCVNHFTK